MHEYINKKLKCSVFFNKIKPNRFLLFNLLWFGIGLQCCNNSRRKFSERKSCLKVIIVFVRNLTMTLDGPSEARLLIS